LSIGILKQQSSSVSKAASLVFVFIPVIGPLFFYMVIATPTRQPFEEQDRVSKFHHRDSMIRSNFREKWLARKPDIERKIERLKEKFEEDD